jgi:hypothetical protein
MMHQAVSNPKPGRLKARYPFLIFDLFECAFSVAVNNPARSASPRGH